MSAVREDHHVGVREVLCCSMRRSRVDQRILTPVDEQRRRHHLLGELPWPLGARVEVGPHQAPQGTQECVIRVRSRIAGFHLTDGLTKSIRRHSGGVGKTAVDRCLHAFLRTGRLHELGNHPLPDPRNRDHREMEIPLRGVPQIRQRGRNQRHRSHKIRSTRGQLHGDGATHGISEQVHRAQIALKDEVSRGSRMPTGRHVAVARRR